MTRIEQYCFQASGFVKIKIPNHVQKIEEYAFSMCQNLRVIVLPKYLQVIPSYCFWQSGVEKIKLPEYLRVIESYAFKECKNLKAIDFPCAL